MQDQEEDPNNTPSTTTPLLCCYICNERFRRPHLLPCLHVFCLRCLQDDCQGNSPDRFFCPLCVTVGEKDRKSVHARPWHSFERILEKETEEEEEEEEEEDERQSQNRPGAEFSAFEGTDESSWDVVGESDDESSSTGSGNSNTEERKNKLHANDTRDSSVLEPPMLFPCTMHADRLADTFCAKCQQLACHKCVSSFHRRCQQFNEVKVAVEANREEFDGIHSKMASNLATCNDVEAYHVERIKQLEEMRTRVLIEIKTFRTELVNMILAKEKALTLQANRMIDQMKTESTAKLDVASKMSESLHKQMEFLDVSISVQGEGELLPLLPGMTHAVENDAKLIGAQYCDEVHEVVFSRDEHCKETITKSMLGEVNGANSEMEDNANRLSSNQNGAATRDLDLTLVTSFHGGTRYDVTEPLLTDLILLANGDVILTDRDNKCVKKFNQSGKLLTRVVIEAVPSRIASVSHGRAVVSVMTKKCLYFLSLFGTVRILNSVPVKKIYSFLTSIGNGLLIAGTNQCDSIDLISERGETLRKIFTQKPDRAIIARPLYLTPVVPHSLISLKLDRPDASTRSNNNKINAQPGSTLAKTNDNNSNTTTANNISSTTVIKKETQKESNNSNSSAVIKNGHNNNNKSYDNNNNNRSNPLSSSLPSTKAVLPQIPKTGKGGATGVGGKAQQSNSPSSSVANSATKGGSSSNSRRRTSLPVATPQHVTNTSSPPHNTSSSSSSSAAISSLSSSLSSLVAPQVNLLSSSSTIATTTTVAASSVSSPSSSSSPSDIALLVSDSGKRVLFRMEQDGTTTFTLKKTTTTATNDGSEGGATLTLECPLGVTVHESGLTLLSDRDRDCVVLVDDRGTFIKDVLTSRDGLSKPCGIYAGNKGSVALSQVDGMVKIYKPSSNTNSNGKQ